MQAYLYDGYWEDIGTIEASIMQIWESPKSQCQILGELVKAVLFIHPTVNCILMIAASSECFMFVATLIAVSTIVHLQSTPNLDTCLHLRCSMLISPIVLLVKDV